MARPRRPNPAAPEGWTTDEWETPADVVEALATLHGPFDLDPAATLENCQAASYFDREQNGLIQPWFGRVWCNPPYSNPGPWVQKCVEELQAGRITHAVFLLPPATDTNWFHDWVLPHATVIFPRGRIAFLDWTGQPVKGARQGNMIAVYPKATP